MAQNLAIALMALFLLLAALFRSVKDSLYVILTIPLASFGGVLALVLLRLFTPQTLDLLTMVGFVVLMGLVVNNAILLVDQARSEMRAGATVRDGSRVLAGHAYSSHHADYADDPVRHVAAGADPRPRQRAVSRPRHGAGGRHGSELGVHAGAAAHAAAPDGKACRAAGPIAACNSPTNNPWKPYETLTRLSSSRCARSHASANAADSPPVPVVVTTARAENIARQHRGHRYGGQPQRRAHFQRSGWHARMDRRARQSAVQARRHHCATSMSRASRWTLRDNEAALKRLDAQLALLATQRARLQNLLGQSVVSQSQLEEALSREQMAEQDVEQARVARDRARLDLDRATVRAPFAGIVAERAAAGRRIRGRRCAAAAPGERPRAGSGGARAAGQRGHGRGGRHRAASWTVSARRAARCEP